MSTEYEMTIGIECHVQLATKSKLFSAADNDARDKEPNAVVSPIDFGCCRVANRFWLARHAASTKP